LGSLQAGVIGLSGQGTSFVAAGTAFVVDIVVSVLISLATTPKPDSELVGLVYSLTPKDSRKHDDTGENAGWYRKPGVLAAIVRVLTIALNILF
jgi:SSS family solute:Na+ symporter